MGVLLKETLNFCKICFVETIHGNRRLFTIRCLLCTCTYIQSNRTHVYASLLGSFNNQKQISNDFNFCMQLCYALQQKCF
jgi:hypothetical protein